MSDELVFSVEEGTVVIHVTEGRLMLPPYTDQVDTAFKEVAKTRDTAMLALEEGMDIVDLAIPSTWLARTRDPAFRLRRIAVVTRKMAVRVAALAFGQANRILNLTFEIRVFTIEPEARVWLQAHGHLD